MVICSYPIDTGSQNNHPLSRKMHNLPLLLLDCLVALMMIGPQSVSAEVLGAVYFRGPGSINPQAISPTRALNEIELAYRAGEFTAEAFGITAGIVVGVFLVLVWLYFKCQECKAQDQGAALLRAEESRVENP